MNSTSQDVATTFFVISTALALGTIIVLFCRCRFQQVTKPEMTVGQPSILAIGLAVPDQAMDWKRLNNFADSHADFTDDARDFFKRVNKSNGNDFRYMAAFGEDGLFNDVNNPKKHTSVEARHELWSKTASKLSIEATNKALTTWGGDKNKITHVVFHSCTGFKAPGIELEIIEACKLNGVQRRLGINFMGCHGAFPGMAVARAFVNEDPNAVVLVVCTEVCSAQFTGSTERSKAIGNSIFGDGSAAVVIGAGKAGDWAIADQSTTTLGPETRACMTWKHGDDPWYELNLDKSLGNNLGSVLFPLVTKLLLKIGAGGPSSIAWCVHPGGRGLLDMFAKGGGVIGGLGRDNLHHSYEVLRLYGNMCSPTVFFVMHHMMGAQDQLEPALRKSHAACLGFGPGLTIETTILRHIEDSHPPCKTVNKQQV